MDEDILDLSLLQFKALLWIYDMNRIQENQCEGAAVFHRHALSVILHEIEGEIWYNITHKLTVFH